MEREKGRYRRGGTPEAEIIFKEGEELEKTIKEILTPEGLVEKISEGKEDFVVKVYFKLWGTEREKLKDVIGLSDKLLPPRKEEFLSKLEEEEFGKDRDKPDGFDLTMLTLQDIMATLGFDIERFERSEANIMGDKKKI